MTVETWMTFAVSEVFSMYGGGGIATAVPEEGLIKNSGNYSYPNDFKSLSEDHLRQIINDSYPKGFTFIHEFGHVVQFHGLNAVMTEKI